MLTHEKPIPGYQVSVVRLSCSVCGAEANATCNCGQPYVPVKERVAEYDEANPGRSTRQAAADLGTSQSAVSQSRRLGEYDYSPETITGRDGKTYKPKRPSCVPDPPAEIRNWLIEQALDAVRKMTPAERAKFIRLAGSIK